MPSDIEKQIRALSDTQHCMLKEIHAIYKAVFDPELTFEEAAADVDRMSGKYIGDDIVQLHLDLGRVGRLTSSTCREM